MLRHGSPRPESEFLSRRHHVCAVPCTRGWEAWARLSRPSRLSAPSRKGLWGGPRKNRQTPAAGRSPSAGRDGSQVPSSLLPPSPPSQQQLKGWDLPSCPGEPQLRLLLFRPGPGGHRWPPQASAAASGSGGATSSWLLHRLPSSKNRLPTSKEAGRMSQGT